MTALAQLAVPAPGSFAPTPTGLPQVARGVRGGPTAGGQAYWKGRTGREMRSRALRADAIETWVCSYLSLALLAGVGLYAAFGWAWAAPVGAPAMLPVILWQGWETLEQAREGNPD